MKGADRIVIAAVPFALSGGEPHVLLNADGTCLRSGLDGGEDQVAATLESLLIRPCRAPDACAERLSPDIGSDGQGCRTITLPHFVSMRMSAGESGWTGCYHALPWEDRRDGDGTTRLETVITAFLRSRATAVTVEDLLFRRKICVLFGLDGWPWRPDLALERWEMLAQAGLLSEWPGSVGDGGAGRWLSAALGHVRKFLRSFAMPVELMPERFTIPQFQAATEGLMGEFLDKQVFRRHVTGASLLEDTGGYSDEVAGRPAKLFRFRIDVAVARKAQGIPLVLPVADGLRTSETIDALLSPVVKPGGNSGSDS